MLNDNIMPGDVLLVDNGEITIERPLDTRINVMLKDPNARRILIGHKTYVPEKHRTRTKEGEKVNFFGVKPYKPSRAGKATMVTGLVGMLLGTPSLFANYANTETQETQKQEKTKEEIRRERYINMIKDNLSIINKARELIGQDPYTLDEYLSKAGIKPNINEEGKETKQGSLESEVLVNENSLNPPTLRIYDKNGNFFNEETITYDLSINRDYHILVPEGGIVELWDPQERGNHEADMIFYHDGRKLNGATQKFQFGKGFNVWDTGDLSVQLEDDDDTPASIRFGWRIVASPPGLEDVYEKESREYEPREEKVYAQEEEPTSQEEPKDKPPKPPIENIYRLKASFGTEDANFPNEEGEGPAFRMFSSHYDFDASFKGKALVHINFINNSHTNVYNSRNEEKFRVSNVRAGVLYAPLGSIIISPTIGAEFSKSKVTQSNTDINNPNIDPHVKIENGDLFLLAKLGLTTGFGDTAIGVLAVAGGHNQSRIRRDNYITYSNFKILEQSDWNQAYGLEAFIDVGRSKDSNFSMFLGGRYMFHKPLSQMIKGNEAINPPLVDAGYFEFDKLSHSLSGKAMIAYQIAHPFSLVAEGNYTSYTMKYLGGGEASHSGFAFRGGAMIKW